MWGKIMIPMHMIYLHGLYGLSGPRCPLSPERLLNLITHSLTHSDHPSVHTDTIHGFRCTKHGGLIIYINEKYSYKLRNLYDKSDVSEGLFIDVNGHNLSKTITIGNMYRPPHDNDNNKNIEKFIDQISPIIDIIQKENSYVAIVSDFNINLLQVNKREKYAEFLDLMCTNSFFLRITLPTRITKRSQSLIDQIFCKVLFNDLSHFSASIVLSAISDHFPCVVNFKILNRKQLPP